jgi:hypothetical protein
MVCLQGSDLVAYLAGKSRQYAPTSKRSTTNQCPAHLELTCTLFHSLKPLRSTPMSPATAAVRSDSCLHARHSGASVCRTHHIRHDNNLSYWDQMSCSNTCLLGLARTHALAC